MTELKTDEQQPAPTARETMTANDAARDWLSEKVLKTRTALGIDAALAGGTALAADVLSNAPDHPGMAPLIFGVLGSFLRPALATARNIEVPTEGSKAILAKNDGKLSNEQTWVGIMAESVRNGVGRLRGARGALEALSSRTVPVGSDLVKA